MFNVFLPKISQAMFSPPGYVTHESYRRFLAHNRSVRGQITFDELVGRGIVICGGPETVRAKVQAYADLGIDHLSLYVHMGQPHEQVASSMKLFAREVMPAFRP